MKLVCIKCKKERELTEEEIKESAEFINKKNMKAMTILKYWNLADGEICDGREHRYGFDKEFLNKITEKVQKTKETTSMINKNNTEVSDIEKRINELNNRMAELSNENDSLIDQSKNMETEIFNTTGLFSERWL